MFVHFRFVGVCVVWGGGVVSVSTSQFNNVQAKVNHSKYWKYLTKSLMWRVFPSQVLVLSGVIIADPCRASVLPFWISPTPHYNWLSCYRTFLPWPPPFFPLLAGPLCFTHSFCFCDEWAWPPARQLVLNQISPWWLVNPTGNVGRPCLFLVVPGEVKPRYSGKNTTDFINIEPHRWFVYWK